MILGGHGCSPGGTRRRMLSEQRPTIDQMGEFVEEHAGPRAACHSSAGRRSRRPSRIATRPSSISSRTLRGAVSSNRRVDRALRRQRGRDDVRELALGRRSLRRWARAVRITSCARASRRCSCRGIPATRTLADSQRSAIAERIGKYREDYAAYYKAFAEPDSPKLRDSNPSVVVIPGLGLFGFGKDKREARITTEFFVNAIHVMAGANALEERASRRRRRGAAAGAPAGAGGRVQELPELRRAAAARGVPDRILGARRGQAAADAAGTRVQPADRDRRRRRQRHRPRGRAADRAARRRTSSSPIQNAAAPTRPRRMRRSCRRPRWCMAAPLDLTSRDTIAAALRATVLAVRRRRHRDQHGGDLSRRPIAGTPVEDVWARTLQINVTSTTCWRRRRRRCCTAQNLPASIVLTSSANAIVPKAGSEPYDVSKAADQPPDSRARDRPRARSCASTASRRRPSSPDRRCSRAIA